MNGSKAKALRRKVYGEQSQRGSREYVAAYNAWAWRALGSHLANTLAPGTITNKPGTLRAKYQAAKRAMRRVTA